MRASISRRAALAGAMATIPVAALPAVPLSAPAVGASLMAELAERFLAADDICRRLSETPLLGVAVEADLADMPGYCEASNVRKDTLRAVIETPAPSLAELKAKAGVLVRELDVRRGGGLDPFASEAETLAWRICKDLLTLG